MVDGSPGGLDLAASTTGFAPLSARCSAVLREHGTTAQLGLAWRDGIRVHAVHKADAERIGGPSGFLQEERPSESGHPCYAICPAGLHPKPYES